MTWAPEDLTGAVAVWVADDIAQSNGTAVTAWADRISAYSLAQGTGSKQPTYLTSGIASQPAVDFDGTDDLLRYAGTLSESLGGSVFMVVEFDGGVGTTAQAVWGSADESSSTRYIYGAITATAKLDLDQRDNDTACAVEGDDTLVVSTPYLLEWSSTGALWTLRRNDDVQSLTVTSSNNGDWLGDTGTGGGSNTRDSFTIGALKRSSEVIPMNGKIAAVIVTSSTLSALDHNRLLDWANTKYGLTMPALVTDYSEQVLADSPAFIWPLEDASGTTAIDISGNARHGTYAGSPSLAATDVLTGEPAWDPDGTNDAVSLAYSSTLAPGTGDFLVEFWIKGSLAHTRATNDYETIFNRDVGDTGNGIIVYTSDNNLAVGALRVWCAGSVLQGAVNVNDGNLHHCWVERRSGVLSFYVDNVLDQSATRSGSASGSGSPVIYAGRSNGGAAPTGTDNYWQTTPTEYLAYWVGSIPSSTRRTVHYQVGIGEPWWIEIQSPNDEAVITALTEDFIVTPYTVSGTVDVEIEWDDDPAFGNAYGRYQSDSDTGVTSGNNVTFTPTFERGHVYYWRARAGDTGLNQWSAWTTPRTIETIAWAPEYIVGAREVWIAEDIAQSDGSAVSSWVGRVSGTNLAQATGSRQPIYRTSGINSQPAVDFDGSDDILVVADDVSTSQTGTIFVVVKVDSPFVTSTVWGSSAESVTSRYMDFRVFDTGQIGLDQRDADVIDGLWTNENDIRINRNLLLECSSDGSEITFRINGAVVAQGTPYSGSDSGDWFADTTARDNFTVGGLKKTATSSFFNGKVAAVVWVDGTIGSEDRTLLEGWLDDTYSYVVQPPAPQFSDPMGWIHSYRLRGRRMVRRSDHESTAAS